MKVIEFEKNSEAWMEFRLGKSGGSQFGKLLPKTNPSKALITNYLDNASIEYDPRSSIEKLLELLTPEQKGEVRASMNWKDEAYKILAQKVARPITPNDYEDELNGQPFSMMARGHILEPVALAKFAELTNKNISDKCTVWVRSDNPDSYVSPDAVVVDGTKIEESVEAKCPDTYVILRAWNEDQLPDEYYSQAIKHFVVNEDLKKHNIILYTDVMPALESVIFTIKRKDIKDDIKMYRAFEDGALREINRLAEKLVF